MFGELDSPLCLITPAPPQEVTIVRMVGPLQQLGSTTVRRIARYGLGGR